MAKRKTLPQYAMPIAGGAPLTLPESAAESYLNAQYFKSQIDLMAKQRAQREAEARARFANVQTPSTAEEADRTMHAMFPSLGLYKKPEPLAKRQPTLDMQREQFDRKRMWNGTWQYGPMVGTQGMPTPVPETREQRLARREAEMREITPALKARLRERAIERGMYGHNADMTRYHPVTNPLGRIVTTGQYRDDGTEMLMDRVSGLPYYQEANTGASSENVGRSMMGEAGVRAGLVTDLGEGASPRYVAKGYTPPVDARAAAQQRFNEYMSGAAERRRRKFESGSVTGDLLDEVRDEASKRIDKFAGEQLDEAGQQLYGTLARRLQEINKLRIRPGQKSRALRQWIDEFDSAGLGRHVVHTPTTQDMLNDSVVDAQGNRWSTEIRDGKPKLVKVADAPNTAAELHADAQKIMSETDADMNPKYNDYESALKEAKRRRELAASLASGEADQPDISADQPEISGVLDEFEGVLRRGTAAAPGASLEAARNFAKRISAEIAKNPALANDPRVKRALEVAVKLLEASGA